MQKIQYKKSLLFNKLFYFIYKCYIIVLSLILIVIPSVVPK